MCTYMFIQYSFFYVFVSFEELLLLSFVFPGVQVD